MKYYKNYIKIALFSLLGRFIFQLLFFLNRIDIKGEKYLTNLINSKKPIMVCVWHGRLLFPSWYLRLKTTNVYAIASRHRDAEIMARILKYWGYGLIRGSTKKGGKEVVKKMANIFKKSGIVAVTNDGPKGPPYIAKAGSASVAIKYDVEIITITGSSTKYWKMKSWDKFMLPKPFGRIQIVVSPPLKISKKLKSSEEIILLSKFMNDYQNQADYIINKI